MSTENSTSTDWLKFVGGIVLRSVVCAVILILLYALSQGPAVYFHNRSIAAGRAGYAPVMTVVYAPMHRIQNWIPFYDAYMKWWMEP